MMKGSRPPGGGPPSWAPAKGYRAKLAGTKVGGSYTSTAASSGTGQRGRPSPEQIEQFKQRLGELKQKFAGKIPPEIRAKLEARMSGFKEKVAQRKANRPARSGMKSEQAAFKTAKTAWKTSKPVRSSGTGFGKSAAMTSWRASKPTKRGMF